MKSKVWIVLVAISALAVGMVMQMRTISERLPESSPQLDFSFPDMKGQTQSVAQWRGQILVINFWATWCPPCLKEIPEFIRWQREFAADSVRFVGIALDDDAAVAEFL
ncbi:MAG: TlpA disulfide reductase family protein, partial [Methylomonas sp.]|nr:TlpA disulfide reductase family protein [Methylomonas sp.]